MSFQSRTELRSVVLTSQPPLVAQRRFLPSGEVVTEQYATACCRSWSECFGSVVSINSTLEQGAGIEGLVQEVRYVSRDLTRRVGKPVVLLDDLLRGAADGEPVGIINADVYLASETKDALQRVKGNRFLAERRTDVDGLGDTSGDPYRHGFDFFVVPADLVPVLLGTELVIGVPWWDHFVPAALILAGARPTGSGLGLAFSLRHDERWAPDLWITYGRLLVRALAARVRVRHLLRSETRRFAWTLLASALMLQISRRDRHASAVFKRVARANMELVERCRVDTGASDR